MLVLEPCIDIDDESLGDDDVFWRGRGLGNALCETFMSCFMLQMRTRPLLLFSFGSSPNFGPPSFVARGVLEHGHPAVGENEICGYECSVQRYVCAWDCVNLSGPKGNFHHVACDDESQPSSFLGARGGRICCTQKGGVEGLPGFCCKGALSGSKILSDPIKLVSLVRTRSYSTA